MSQRSSGTLQGRPTAVFGTRPGAPPRRPLAGYALTLAAAANFAVAGNVAAALMRDGVEPVDLSQYRILGCFVPLLLFAALRRRLGGVPPRALPALLTFGVVGTALVQLTYYGAVDRIPIAVAGLLQLTGVIVALLFSVLVYRLPTSRMVWPLAAVALLGAFFVIGGQRLGLHGYDTVGIALAGASAVCFAAYFLVGERAVARLPLPTVLAWGYLAASATWVVLDIAWLGPPALPAAGKLAGISVVVLLGTLLPIVMATAAIRLLGASAASLSNVATPALSGLLAWFALGQHLPALQIVGGVVALGAIGVLQVIDVRRTRTRTRTGTATATATATDVVLD